MKDDSKIIYQDARGLFERSKPKYKYEIVEIIEEISVKYSKKAKHKDYSKTKRRTKERQVTDKKIATNIMRLLNNLEEHDDVQNVYSNFDISDEIMAEIDA